MSNEQLPVKVPGQSLKCHAHSSQTGLPCQNEALDGMRVCRTHSGSTTLARKAGQERLDRFLDEAIGHVEDLARQREFLPTALAANKLVIDRVMGQETKQAPGNQVVVNVAIGVAELLRQNKPEAHIDATVVTNEPVPDENGDGEA
jgi:hypothetical protein